MAACLFLQSGRSWAVACQWAAQPACSPGPRVPVCHGPRAQWAPRLTTSLVANQSAHRGACSMQPLSRSAGWEAQPLTTGELLFPPFPIPQGQVDDTPQRLRPVWGPHPRKHLWGHSGNCSPASVACTPAAVRLVATAKPRPWQDCPTRGLVWVPAGALPTASGRGAPQPQRSPGIGPASEQRSGSPSPTPWAPSFAYWS